MYMITLNKAFIRFKKWALNMLTYATDLRYVNAWVEYSKTLSLNIPKNSGMDVLHLRVYIAERLIFINKDSKKRKKREMTSKIHNFIMKIKNG